MLKESNGAVTISVRVVPRSNQNQIIGFENNSLKIRLTASPIDGKANDALIKLLAEIFGVRQAQIEIVRGERSRQKILRVRGFSAVQVQQKIAG